MIRWTAAWLVLAGLWACDDGGGGGTPDAAPPAVDATADAGVDPDRGLDEDATVADADLPDQAAPDMAVADAFVAPPPGTEAAEPTPFPAVAWLLGRPGRTDEVYPLIEREAFEAPAAPGRAQGIDWEPATLAENGAIDGVGNGIAYLAARITVDAPTHLLLRPDRVLEVAVNGKRLPGDVYGDGKQRIPVRLDPGENHVVLRVYGQRGAPSIALWSTPDPIALNLADQTLPDPRVGDDQPQYIGLPILVFGDAPVTEVTTRVLESDVFAATRMRWPALPGGASTQVGFELRPRAPLPTREEPVLVTLQVESPDLPFAYTAIVSVTLSAEGAYRRTFLSPVDHSIQYYGVQPPPVVDPARDYALVLSLHGAGVEGIGQARAYSAKDWAYLIAPTNRRPFGFDWEEWGHLNGLNALADATRAFRVDPTRMYVTGHSMGGHGTWQFGVHDGGRFAVVGPSAGWSSFYTYTGRARPTGPFARARAHSDTDTYVENLVDKAVYIIHGSADDNVPVREGRAMRDAVSQVSDDVHYHEQEGAGHWWDGDASPGADCVDWPPLFELMQARTVDPLTTDFHFRSPSPAYNPRRSYVEVTSVETADRDFQLDSVQAGDRVDLTTDNVRSLVLDGDALQAKGVATVAVDGMAVPVAPGPLAVGPTTGKRRGVQGPFNQAFHRPYCYIYPDRVPEFARFAAYMTTTWTMIGNGHACALPYSRRDLAGDRQRVYLGLEPAQIGDVPFTWDDREIVAGDARHLSAALAFVFDDGDRLGAVMTATARAEHLLYRAVPFSSGAGLPDYLIWADQGGRAAGFFGPDWAAP
ncbi:MAG: prolyl oligopeptidase family serine peptidase [Myxococcales bacterium]|nr:prolyl oligopeptidase family serine peptidase [Myxococcales bacterium]